MKIKCAYCSRCLNFVVQVLDMSIQKDRTTAFAVSKFYCSRQVDGNPSSCHCRVSVY